MKKLTVVIVLGLGLSFPLGAIASPDDEVTIRVMEMHEYSKESVMQIIELPVVALEHGKQVNRERVREREGEDGHDNADMDHGQEPDMENSYIELEQEHENFGPEIGQPKGN